MKAGGFLTGVMGLLAALSLGGFADGLSAPRVTLSVADEPLTAVLGSIAEQAGVSIVMTNEAAGREPTSLKIRNAELENALDQALGGYNYTLSFSAEQNVISKVLVTVQAKKEGVAVPTGSSFEAIYPGKVRPHIDGRVAEEYYRDAVAKQKPIVPPEGLAQADVDQAYRELRQLQSSNGGKR